MAGSTPNLYDGLQVSLHPGCAQGQGQGQRSRDTSTFVLAQKWLLLAGSLIATKLAHDGHQVNLHPGCSRGQGHGQRSRDTRTFFDSWNELLRHGRSGFNARRVK